ncbi:hypothetical protein SAMN05661080_03651 [Modestobacter sp. DSM 44400]|uniref:ScyD/ScyE family protein n=1 Tax=Modestobacter sp. DSM 44400 TaxID=1550230 RepID=UPI00089B0873|nr:ScyD/ScyE family protein [Modestobacter sp. DSM 44400]SDY49600.1 hypothetical protein SAMN05661080_03651 [Modestobacter sp. DSM 44400]
MCRFTAHAGVGILVLGTLSVGFAGSASAGEDHHGGSSQDSVVVVTGLDNPRQLSWGPHDTLLVAEAGSGGETCITPPAGEEAPPEASGPQCVGLTGGISSIHDPDDVVDEPAERVVDGLLSVAGPDGSFAVGSNGADATDVPGEYIVAETFVPGGIPPAGAAIEGADQLGHLLVVQTDGGQQFVLPYADIAAAEAEQNPDGAQVDSNPYAVLFVDPTPDGEPGTDGYALVADAAANTVWQVTPDFSAVPADCIDDACIPPYEITVFATYPTPPDDEITPEFVPTSLATDHDGNVYVGGLGSEQPGAAAVVEYSADGEETTGWGGFTGITGLAVDAAGEHLYVSQIFGSVPDETATAPPGNVVDVDLTAGRYRSVDVPFPGGVAVDHKGRVFVAAFSVSPAEGVPAADGSPALPGGQLWRISFDGVPDVGLPVFFPQDTGGKFVPARQVPTLLDDHCGQPLLLVPGDLAGEWKVTRDEFSDRIDFRGAATVDILGQQGQLLVDELDISGMGYQISRVDGSVKFSFDGPNVNYAFDPEEAAAYEAAGLSSVFYWTSGTFTEVITTQGDIVVVTTPADLVDICTLLPAV